MPQQTYHVCVFLHISEKEPEHWVGDTVKRTFVGPAKSGEALKIKISHEYYLKIKDPVPNQFEYSIAYPMVKLSGFVDSETKTSTY